MTKKNLFTSENQPDGSKKIRGRDKRALVLEALREALPESDDPERAFYEECVKRALNKLDPASAVLTKELLLRLYPVPKPVMPATSFVYPVDGSASERINAIGNAIAGGECPADLGKMMVDIITAGVRIFEVTELAERLARIEEMLTSGSGATP